VLFIFNLSFIFNISFGILLNLLEYKDSSSKLVKFPISDRGTVGLFILQKISFSFLTKN
jgi:hypothetical protein